MTFEDFILSARENNASDIHMTVGAPTVFRINGELVRLKGIGDDVVNRTILSMLTAEQERQLAAGEDLDFVFEISTGARQRVNVYRQMGKIAAAIRLLNSEIASISELGLPQVLYSFAKKKSGLILVTGATGSGKSTTLASIVDEINKTRACHIITIEDPVEYKYTTAQAIIHQREIGRDVPSFQAALRSALREDPDVILVGELRDYETIQIAMSAAETGHLVLATLHTRNTSQTIARIIDACPPEIRTVMQAQLAQTIEGIVSQVLIPKADGKGRVAALEVLVGTDAVKNLIRSEKTYNLESTIQQNGKVGMILMDDSIIDLYNKGLISRQVASEYVTNKNYFKQKI